MSLSAWASRGYVLHAFEAKVSRSDWLRELKDPAKAEAAAAVCDKFTVVVSDVSIVKDGELPVTWGLMAPTKAGDRLRVVQQAPLLKSLAACRAPLSRSFVVAFMRAGGAVPEASTAAEDAAFARGVDAGRAAAEAADGSWKGQFDRLKAKVDAFERESGLTLGHWDHQAAEIGDAVRRLLASDAALTAARSNLEIARAAADRAVQVLETQLEALPTDVTSLP
ncbi:MAG TPA: hypothetical protein VHD87_14885 [Acidimicrobiales bacterium]|nr:hypothetical protein [Acidimicrobiales bacterium]